MEFHM